MLDQLLELLLAADAEQLAAWAGYVVIGLFVLIQWFLSLRPWIIWGLAAPAMFVALWIVVLNPPEMIPSQLGEILTAGSAVYIIIAQTGLGVSLGILILSRVGMWLNRRRRARRRQQRLEEKRQRQMKEAALLAEGEPGNVPLSAPTPFNDI